MSKSNGPGRPPFEDGKTTQGLSVRMSPEARKMIRDIARTEKKSVAIVTGELIEEALATRVTHD